MYITYANILKKPKIQDNCVAKFLSTPKECTIIYHIKVHTNTIIAEPKNILSNANIFVFIIISSKSYVLIIQYDYAFVKKENVDTEY